MSIKYRLTPVEVEKDGKQVTQYRPNALRGSKISVSTHLIPDIAEQKNLSENLLRRFVETMSQTVKQRIAEGDTVIFDKWFVLRPGLTGEFDKADHKLESGDDGLRNLWIWARIDALFRSGPLRCFGCKGPVSGTEKGKPPASDH